MEHALRYPVWREDFPPFPYQSPYKTRWLQPDFIVRVTGTNLLTGVRYYVLRKCGSSVY